jgi:predicted extracellular nuclease
VRALRFGVPVVLSAVLALPLVAVVAVPAASAAPSPDLVVSQIYGGGGNSGAPFNADFVELFNRDTVSRSLGGMSLQYASATGTGNLGANATQLVALTALTVPPGGAVLIGMTPGATGAPLPTPDVTGTINLAAGAGKVALVDGVTSLGCNGGSTPCDSAQLARIVDLVGYGNANFFEGSAAAPTLGNTLAAARAGGGCADSDDNAADFAAGAPAPRSTATPLTPCGPVQNTPPSITPNPFTITHPLGTTASYPVVATDDVSVATVTVDSTVPSGVSIDTGTPGGSRTITVTVAAAVVAGDYSIALTLSDDVGASTAASVVITVAAVDPCGGPVTTTIEQVQGSGVTSPLVGQTVRIEGIVTASFQASGQVGGFYLQDPAGDNDPVTSDGILVFDNTDRVEAGHRVRIGGRVTEFERAANAGQGTVTELGGPITEPVVCGRGLGDLVQPTVLELPFPTETMPGVAYQERFEGMLARFPQQLTATEVFTLGRFGEIALTFGPPLPAPTNGNVPGTPEAIHAANEANRILLDDALSGSNIYPGAYQIGGDPNALPRVGDHVAPGDEVQGVFTFDFGVYRVQPVGDYVGFVTGDPRQAAPDPVGGDVTIASFNVLNYFTTLNNAAWQGAPDTPRGAVDAAEFQRQQTKIVQGIVGLDADIVGLIEIENNGPTADVRVGPDALQSLVTAVNAALPGGALPYAAIDDPDLTAPNFLGGRFGTDAIKVALLYRPAVVTPAGGPLADPALVDPPDPAFPSLSLFNRPPLVQTFTLASGTGEPLTVVVNHLKSKGSLADNCDPAGGGLQGNCNDLRIRQAQGVLDLVHGAGLTHVALVGDLNSNTLEDPILRLGTGGFTGPVSTFVPVSDRYSYVFDGERGELDHILVDGSLAPSVTGADIWHINSPEPPAKDYTSFNNLALYEPNAFRSSDHDPVLVGIDLTPGPVITAPATLNAVALERTSAPVSAVASGATVTALRLTVTPSTSFITLRTTSPSTAPGQPVQAELVVGPLTPVRTYSATLTATTSDGHSASALIEVIVTPNQRPTIVQCPAELRVRAGVGGSVAIRGVDPDSPIRTALVTRVRPFALVYTNPALFPTATTGQTVETRLVVSAVVPQGTYTTTVTFASVTAVSIQTFDCVVSVVVERR